MRCIHSVAYKSTHPLNIKYCRKNFNSTNFFDALTRVLLKYNTIYLLPPLLRRKKRKNIKYKMQLVLRKLHTPVIRTRNCKYNDIMKNYEKFNKGDFCDELFHRRVANREF